LRATDALARRLRAVSRAAMAPKREQRLSPASAAAARLATRTRALGLRLLGTAKPAPASPPAAPAAPAPVAVALPKAPPALLAVLPMPAPAWPPTVAAAAAAANAALGAENERPTTPLMEAVPRSPAVFFATPASCGSARTATPQSSAGGKAAGLQGGRQRSFGSDVTNGSSASPLLMR
jgi:hypothetical protein